MTELAKNYDPTAVQDQINAMWDDRKTWHAEPDADADPYVIVIPPPNVTAALHMGHALNNTLQDILVRWRRMQGRNAVWIPGTDHAGIATQTVVEKRVMQEEGKRRIDFDRDEFVGKIQAWKDEYEKVITGQLKAMGSSCDWDRQRFTMDETCARAVREAFFELFKAGLIYRGKRLVNWDPVTQTALADDEVENQEIDGSFWYMKYPVVDDASNPTGEHVTVATTRPETMLGDTAVAVNPNDPERAKFIGKLVLLPIVNRVIPVVGDDYVVIPDAESSDVKAKYASGFLKVTPAHDPNDYEIGQRHDLDLINVMAPDGSISKDHGWTDWDDSMVDPFATQLLGQDRYEARESIVNWFRDHDLLAEVRPYSHSVGHSYRSHVPVEPYLSDQWYVKVTDDRLAGAALRSMTEDQRSESDGPVWRDGGSFDNPQSDIRNPQSDLRFYPARYAKTFQSWHENIRDWCISRQLWWGHRIPVWRRDQAASAEFVAEHAEQFEALIDQLRAWQADGRIAMQYRGEFVSPDNFEVNDPSLVGFFVCVPDAENDSEITDWLESKTFVQDPDVLDTWFSSGLWPVSTLGWPEEEGNDALQAWNPSSTLCTAREIITLWVSRMVMFNQFFRGCLPFTDVFIHAMIQDGEGQKMSKSLGNGVDPLDIIHSHGADAMRFALTQMTTQTQDVRMPVDVMCPHCAAPFDPRKITTKNGHVVAAPTQDCLKCAKPMVTSYGVAVGEAKPSDDAPLARNSSPKFDNGRNFANKIWNAGRFALGKLDASDRAGSVSDRSLADRWILNRLARTIADIDKALDEYQFNRYADAVYDFFWRDLCDWYLEAIKSVAPGTPEAAAANATLTACLDAALRLMHPVMPYVSEAMWAELNRVSSERGIEGLTLPPNDIAMTARWPEVDAALVDDGIEAAFETTRNVVVAIRNVRNEYEIKPKQNVTVAIKATGDSAATLTEAKSLIETLAGSTVRAIDADATPGGGAATVVVGDSEIYIEDLVEEGAETERLAKRQQELTKSVGALTGRLANKGYTDKAPEHLVQQTRDQLAEAERELATVTAKLAELD